MWKCTRNRCNVPAEGEYREVQVNGRAVRFDGCPISHIDPESVGMWLDLYHWLSEWQLTPVSMGVVTMDRLDPRYFDVMRLISTALKPKPNGT